MPTYGGFLPRQQVMGRASIADLFPLRHRSGLYTMHFSNGELCTGQTLDWSAATPSTGWFALTSPTSR